MNYRNPQEVTSPQDAVSNIRVILDQGEDGVSIAILDWYGQPNIGIRWNISHREWDNEDKVNELIQCVGNPVSRGHSTWFILPQDLFNEQSEMFSAIKKALEL
jgi:hypothetical protein